MSEDKNDIYIKDDDIIEDVTDDDKIHGYQRNKFKGFGEYNHPLLKENEKRINELVEMVKKEYPTLDNYMIWIIVVDYMMEELMIEKDENAGKELYENALKERDKLLYDNVNLITKIGRAHV